MHNRKKQLIKCILLLCLLLVPTSVGTSSVAAQEYTEEQKQQAKAWLSAHGYAPTREGAYQAYADYKSGKLKIDMGDVGKAKESLKNKKKAKKKTQDKKTKKKAAKKSVKKTSKEIAEPNTDEAPSITKKVLDAAEKAEQVVKESGVSQSAVGEVAVSVSATSAVEELETSQNPKGVFFILGGVLVGGSIAFAWFKRK